MSNLSWAASLGPDTLRRSRSAALPEPRMSIRFGVKVTGQIYFDIKPHRQLLLQLSPLWRWGGQAGWHVLQRDSPYPDEDEDEQDLGRLLEAKTTSGSHAPEPEAEGHSKQGREEYFALKRFLDSILSIHVPQSSIMPLYCKTSSLGAGSWTPGARCLTPTLGSPSTQPRCPRGLPCDETVMNNQSGYLVYLHIYKQFM